MRFQILEKIKAEDNLALLFNAYMERLCYLEITVMPRENMREFRRLFTDVHPDFSGLKKREKQQAKNMLTTIPEFYRMQILSDALGSLHRGVTGAIETLTEFFEKYDGDLKRYAIEQRIEGIQQDGSDDETDWYRENPEDENEEWKVVYKDDQKTLINYSLHNYLGYYFEGGADSGRGEHIGTSGIEDFAYYTGLVARHADFDPFKKIAEFAGAEIPVYRQNEDGEMVRQSIGDQAESALNDEIASVRTACYFMQIIERLQYANGLYIMGEGRATGPDSYQMLLQLLITIRDCEALTEPLSPLNTPPSF